MVSFEKKIVSGIDHVSQANLVGFSERYQELDKSSSFFIVDTHHSWTHVAHRI